MKYLIGLIIAIMPFCAFGGNFVYHEYTDYENEYWYDEYWDDPYWCDGYWVYYPHGYYCVRYVWWYPWWWDYYWSRCHWCHHFTWDFYYCGFYVVWYESGSWWYRPRYGRWVRYRMPYTYHEIRYYSQLGGISLPSKPPREINVPYKEQEVMNLARQKDPELFKQVEKEHKSGNLEKMRKEYDVAVKKEIQKKNVDYKANKDVSVQKKTFSKGAETRPGTAPVPYKAPEKKVMKNPYTDEHNNKTTKKTVTKTPVRNTPEYKAPTKKQYSKDDDGASRSHYSTPEKNAPTYNKPEKKTKNTKKKVNTKSYNDNDKSPGHDVEKRVKPNVKR
jgi:hypothetical protein